MVGSIHGAQASVPSTRSLAIDPKPDLKQKTDVRPDAKLEPSAQPTPIPESDAGASEPTPVANAPTTTPEEKPDGKGVLRLLEAGHFKGVADLRLRMNFAEELESRELPELSKPQGNGRAYERFLAAYNASFMQTESKHETDPPLVRLDEAA